MKMIRTIPVARNREFDASRRSGGNLVAHGFSRGMTTRRTCDVPEPRQICRGSGTYTRSNLIARLKPWAIGLPPLRCWYRFCCYTPLVAALVLLVSSLQLLAAGDGLTGVPRFQQVSGGLFRGGQPSEKGFRELKAKGVRAIINLRVDDSERKLVESLGMKYIHIPVAMPLLTRPWKKMESADIAAFFKAVDDPLNQPVFVHCRRGADRTGMMIGMYRISRDNWDGAGAYREAREIGMRWWFRSFKDQLLSFQ